MAEPKEKKVVEKEVKATEDKPKKEPVKKPVKKAKPQAKPYAHIDDFLRAAKPVYGLDNLTVAGFKAYMTGKHYLENEKDFIPHLDKYLGKKGR